MKIDWSFDGSVWTARHLGWDVKIWRYGQDRLVLDLWHASRDRQAKRPWWVAYAAVDALLASEVCGLSATGDGVHLVDDWALEQWLVTVDGIDSGNLGPYSIGFYRWSVEPDADEIKMKSSSYADGEAYPVWLRSSERARQFGDAIKRLFRLPRRPRTTKWVGIGNARPVPGFDVCHCPTGEWGYDTFRP